MNERASSCVRTGQAVGASECGGGRGAGFGGAGRGALGAGMGSAAATSVDLFFDFEFLVFFGHALGTVAIVFPARGGAMKFNAR